MEVYFLRSLVLAIIPIVFSTLCVGMANAKDASVNVVSCEYKVDGVGIKLTEKEGEMELKLEKDTSEFSRLISNKSADAMALLSEYLSVESYDELYRQQGSHSFSGEKLPIKTVGLALLRSLQICERT